MIKRILIKLSKLFAKSLIEILSSFNYGRAFVDIFIKNVYLKTKTIKHGDIKLNFYIPNRLTYWRIKTFSSKEPHTLSWIESFEKDSVFFDIGANIGLYTCYAGKLKNCKIYSFEPSIFNLEILGKNIFLNNLNDNVTMISNPLTDQIKESNFNMSSTEQGSAISSFGVAYKHDGSNLKKVFSHKTIGLSIDEAINIFKIKQPDYIKIDVDGIEHLILKGAFRTLKNTKEVLVEIDHKFQVQIEETNQCLKQAGFRLFKKEKSEQIWKK